MSNPKVEPTLDQLVERGILPADKEFREILDRACMQPGTYLGVCNLVERTIEFITPSCLPMTGFSADEFVAGGTEFLFTIATSDSIPPVLQVQREYVHRSKQPGFDPYLPIIIEYPCSFNFPIGFKKLVSLGVGLTYNRVADMEYGVAMMAEARPETLAICRAFLTRLKERHNKIYRHQPFAIDSEPLKRVYILQGETQKLTRREEDVLKLLADGLTSQQIAGRLSMKENTVETHRKNLLAKFEAKNIAELIKKASKIYWLE